MNVLAFGASRNIGYYAALRLFSQGSTITFLLRSHKTFDDDNVMQGYIASGKARIVAGDALNENDVKRAWDSATEVGNVDLVLFTVGGTVADGSFHLIKGVQLARRSLCTSCLHNVLSTMPTTSTPPKVVAITSTGVGRQGFDNLPIPLKPVYGYLLKQPLEDKLGVERLIYHVSGREWTEQTPIAPEVLGPGWEANLSAVGPLETVLLQPARLTNGVCKADAGSGPGYRVADQNLGGAYSISRKDVAHFVGERLLNEWSQWKGKTLVLAY